MNKWISAGIVVAAVILWGILVVRVLVLPQPVPVPPPEELPAPIVEPWKGRVECKHGNMSLYTVNNLVDFIVSAQPSGWMWEMFQEDGTVVLFHQPERVFCYAIAEEA